MLDVGMGPEGGAGGTEGVGGCLTGSGSLWEVDQDLDVDEVDDLRALNAIKSLRKSTI